MKAFVLTHCILFGVATLLHGLLFMFATYPPEKPPLNRCASVMRMLWCFGFFVWALTLITGCASPRSVALKYQDIAIHVELNDK
jgi:hypothetical protein